jgi:membrane protein insertase Oxa1/YidC/SpoIIIJ
MCRFWPFFVEERPLFPSYHCIAPNTFNYNISCQRCINALKKSAKFPLTMSHVLQLSRRTLRHQSCASHVVSLASGPRHWPSTAATKNAPWLTAKRGFATYDAFTSATWPNLAQVGLLALHSTLGMPPWWLTVASTTVIVRSLQYPLMHKHILVLAKLEPAMPDLRLLTSLYRQRIDRLNKKTQIKEFVSLSYVYTRGCLSCLRSNDIVPSSLFVYPLASFGMFFYFIQGVRSLLVGEHFGLMGEGGFAWFVNLAAKDETYVLPITAVALSYLSIEHAFLGQPIRGGTLILKDLTQSTMIIILPFALTLQSGVFCYWIPSVLFGMGQAAVLRNPTVRAKLGLPPRRIGQSNPETDKG